MTIYISGATGYIGTQLVQKLLQRDDAILKTIGRSEGADIRWDLLDSEQEMRFEPGSVVVHLAGVSNENELSAETIHQINNKATRDLAKACKSSGISHFVFLSTCAVFSPSEQRISEVTSTGPQGPYGESKLRAEEGLAGIFSGTDTKVTVLRPSSVYGKESSAKQSTIASLESSVGRGRFLFLGEGANMKSFVHVTDVVRAIEHVVYPTGDAEETLEPSTYILSSQSMSTRALIDKLCSRLGGKKIRQLPLGPVLFLNKILLNTPVIAPKAVRIQNSLDKWISNFDIDGGKITKDTGFNYEGTLG